MVRYSEIIKEEYESYENRIEKNRQLRIRVTSELSKYYDLKPFNKISISDGKVDFVKGNVTTKKGITELPDVGFYEIDKDFFVNNTNLKNLINSPIKVGGGMNVFDNLELESLEGLPTEIGDVLNIMNCPKLKSLEGLEAKSNITHVLLSYLSTLPMLRLLLVKNFITFLSGADNTKNIEDILNKYIRNKDMQLYEKQMRCQHELLEYPEYRLNAEW